MGIRSDDLCWWCLCWCSPAPCWLSVLQQHCSLPLSLSVSTPNSPSMELFPRWVNALFLVAYALFLDYVFQVQDLTFLLVELYKGLVSLLFQTIHVLVLSDSLFPSMHCPAQFTDISKLHQDPLNPIPDHFLRYGTVLGPILVVSTSGRMPFKKGTVYNYPSGCPWTDRSPPTWTTMHLDFWEESVGNWIENLGKV